MWALRNTVAMAASARIVPLVGFQSVPHAQYIAALGHAPVTMIVFLRL